MSYLYILKADTFMDRSSNLLQGGIPEALTDVVALKYLMLSKNRLEGGILAEFVNLQDLETLDLSQNWLMQLHVELWSRIACPSQHLELEQQVGFFLWRSHPLLRLLRGYFSLKEHRNGGQIPRCNLDMVYTLPSVDSTFRWWNYSRKKNDYEDFDRSWHG